MLWLWPSAIQSQGPWTVSVRLYDAVSVFHVLSEFQVFVYMYIAFAEISTWKLCVLHFKSLEECRQD